MQSIIPYQLRRRGKLSAFVAFVLVTFLVSGAYSNTLTSDDEYVPLTRPTPPEARPGNPPPSKVRPAKNIPKPPRHVKNAASLFPILPPDFPDEASLLNPTSLDKLQSPPISRSPRVVEFPEEMVKDLFPEALYHGAQSASVGTKGVLPREGQWTPPEGSFAATWTAPKSFDIQDRDEDVPLNRIQFDFEGRTESNKAKALRISRRDVVRNAFLHAWEGYKSNAWGHDEVGPVSGKPGATIIDSLDTLLLMGLQDEYIYARKHVRELDFGIISGINWDKGPDSLGRKDVASIHAFETVIRYMGGLLGAYDLSGDSLLLQRAEELGKIILPVFDTSSGVPMSRLKPKNPEPVYTGHGIQLAEAGSLMLEYTRLSQLTGNQTYFNMAQRGMDYIDQVLIPKSPYKPLLPVIFSTEGFNGNLLGTYSFGGMADSYYEYLLKQHILLRGKISRYAQLYSNTIDKASETIFREVGVVHGKKLTTVGEMKNGKFQPAMEHLSCFVGGMLAMGSRVLSYRSKDLFHGRRISQTCYYLGSANPSGLQSERSDFYKQDDPKRYEIVVDEDSDEEVFLPRGSPPGVRVMHKQYMSRPEAIETVWYMYRITGDEKYQNQGWRMFTDWISKTEAPFGFSSVNDVKLEKPGLTDKMESFVLAETFKYYFLLFSDPSELSLDDYVLNTEAHPFIHHPDRKPGFSKMLDKSRIPRSELHGEIGKGTNVQKFGCRDLLLSLNLIPEPTETPVLPKPDQEHEEEGRGKGGQVI
ncbi:1, 2-alpha-mannosidase [Phaffia rhodozyma]|uniref:alpha-1,2-Mannosidase n=1 Tax=Phaffia rhodozyma TaxID=264483 RepID=A0A0F7SX26_PHARH|nr:1, 2-alpha-mannosidase [Phaffia rhodozyma]